MTQEVRVMLQITLEVDAELSKEDITKRVQRVMMENGNFNYPDMDIIMSDIVEIREEAEIYGDEEE